MNDFDHLREQAMWDFHHEPPAVPTPAAVGVVACIVTFLGLAVALEI